MKGYKIALLVVATCLSISTIADTITINPGSGGSTTDLFQAATVVNAANIWGSSDINDAFGWMLGSGEPGTVLGSSLTVGSWIHFRTASTSVNQFTVTLGEDFPSGDRSSSNVYIWRSIDGGSNWINVFTQALAGDYLTTYGSSMINVVATFDTAITGEDWLVGWDPADAMGARLLEVDGMNVIPEPATMGLVALFGGGLFLVRRTFMI